jgi:16S rRNA (guanine527-N7)-methyltransferase
VRLVEPRRTRVAFLELAVDALGLPNVEVLASRVEDVSGAVDVCFARAFAPARDAWAAAARLLRAGGRLVYFAGATGAGILPNGPSAIEVLDSSVLESAGSLIIMSR